MSNPASNQQTTLSKYKFQALVGSYVLITGFFVFRIARNPLYSGNLKFEQIESVFKATTLGAVCMGIAIAGGWGRGRSWKQNPVE